MNYSPHQIAELARAALARPSVVGLPFMEGVRLSDKHREAVDRYLAVVRDPATVLALIEWARSTITHYADDEGMAAGIAMTTPLTPTAPRAGEGE